MSKSTKYDRIKTEFTIRKSPSGKYHFFAMDCGDYFTKMDYKAATCEEIANDIGQHITETMKVMSDNNATAIKIIMSWK